MPRGNGNVDHIVLQDARIIFKNFAGKEGPFNRQGDRNFAVVLDDPKMVKTLEKGDWNVKYLKPREEGDEPQPYLQVSVNFNGRPPKVAIITSRGRTNLGEREVEMLDWADIVTCDLIIRPYNWEVNGKSGVKAYLQSLFATIEEDELELKYADVDDARSGRLQQQD